MKKLNDLLPPGADARGELIKSAAFAAVFLLFWSMTFFAAYANAYNALFTVIGNEKFLMGDAVMASFSSLMRGRFAGFWVYLIAMLTGVIWNYLTFIRSHSIYVMKRVRDPLELHRRCLSLPLLSLAAGIFLIFLLIGLYAVFYRLVTPEAAYAGLTLDFLEMFL